MLHLNSEDPIQHKITQSFLSANLGNNNTPYIVQIRPFALLIQIYWVTGATLGALLGYVIKFDSTGIEFVMTALFAVMFIDQWKESEDHTSALVGLCSSVLCLIVFGSKDFILPTMVLIILCFTLIRHIKEK